MYKAINNLKEQKGFTLIELLIVVAIIGILAAVAIPGYIGMQERGRKGAAIRVAESSVPELQAWMNSAKKAGGPQGSLWEIDTNGDGVISSQDDVMNTNLNVNGFLDDNTTSDTQASWADLNNRLKNQKSPWSGSVGLWRVDTTARATEGACRDEAFAGQINLCYTPADDATVRTIFIIVNDITDATVGTKGGATLYQKTVSSD